MHDRTLDIHVPCTGCRKQTHKYLYILERKENDAVSKTSAAWMEELQTMEERFR